MVKVVTDSVASLPQDMLEDLGIEVVSLYLNEEGHEHIDATMDVDDFYTRIGSMADNPPTSSQPSQAAFVEAFERIAAAGEELLGIWISTELSGTVNGALTAAHAVAQRYPDFKFAMVNTFSCGFDEAWPVVEGARAAREGKSLEEAKFAALNAIERTRFLFTPDSLTFLQKGGRIGGAAALLGNLINLAPVLTVVDGIPQATAKVRTRKKALAKIVKLLEQDIAKSGGLKEIVVHYIGDKAPAVKWANEVIEPLLNRSVRVLPVSPVIGLHVGPAIGIAYECVAPLEGKVEGDVARLAYV